MAKAKLHTWLGYNNVTWKSALESRTFEENARALFGSYSVMRIGHFGVAIKTQLEGNKVVRSSGGQLIASKIYEDKRHKNNDVTPKSKYWVSTCEDRASQRASISGNLRKDHPHYRELMEALAEDARYYAQ